MACVRRALVPFFSARTGKPALDKNANGSACVYLQEDCCSIYDRRPGICRQFDCRPAVLCGIKTPDVYNRAAWDKFEFLNKAPQDAELRWCLYRQTRLMAPLVEHHGLAAANMAIEIMRGLLNTNPDVRDCFAHALAFFAEKYRALGLDLRILRHVAQHYGGLLPPLPEDSDQDDI